MRERVLGIDPGSYHLGIGCISQNGNQLITEYFDVLSAPQKLPLYERLKKLSEQLDSALVNIGPTQVAIEDIFFGRNVRSAFHLGLARGVALAACFKYEVQVYEYAPTQVKSVVTGYGRADKAQVKKMVELLLGIDVQKKHDASDALAVAICHLNRGRNYSEGDLNC